ncbi:MAG: peptide chain release factor 1 [Clostridia bacterium]|nr:peptide chain release factor 1 [Clostridia bacterium]
MFEKFDWIIQREEELSIALSQPETLQNQTSYQKLLKEHAQLLPQAEAWRAYQKLLAHLQEAEEMAQEPELAQIAQDEIALLNTQKAEAELTLRLMLLPKDPDDDRSVVMEIRAGAGGEEAALFAADLMRMYAHYAEHRGFKVEPVSENPTELGGLKEAVFMVSGPGAFARLKFESGVHRVQRVPITDSTGKKQTSTCTVAVLPEAEAVDVIIDPKDVRVDVYRSTGHGGQCVNTTDSAVRITHLPTGLVVTCQDQKSQLKNRDQAMKVLRSRLLEKTRSEADAAYANRRRLQVGTGDRSERIRTYNFHESRVTDHRIGLTLYKIDAIMNGDLDEIIDALRIKEQAQLLKEGQ